MNKLKESIIFQVFICTILGVIFIYIGYQEDQEIEKLDEQIKKYEDEMRGIQQEYYKTLKNLETL